MRLRRGYPPRPSAAPSTASTAGCPNVEHGRFERSLSGLTAFAAAVTTAEIYVEHYRASFGNKMMWSPIIVTPPVIIAGIGGVFSRRWAKTALPITAAIYTANGLLGEYFHARGVARRPGRLLTAELQHPDGAADHGPGTDDDRRRDGAAGRGAAPRGLGDEPSSATSEQADHLPNLRPDRQPRHPSWLPRQRQGTTPQMIGRYPDYDVMENAEQLGRGHARGGRRAPAA